MTLYELRCRLRYLRWWPQRRRFKILSVKDTLTLALKTRCSISRFGDGEIGFALYSKGYLDMGSQFQNLDPILCRRLLQILENGSSEEHNVLVCLVRFPYKKIKNLKPSSTLFWMEVCVNTIKYLRKHLNFKSVYGDAFISRFYMTYKNKSESEETYQGLKRLWDGEDLLIVEGEKSRLGVGNDVFDNAKSVRRILCPPKDAFSAYDRIKGKVLAHANPGDTIILALGMTATVLAYDLGMEGYRALDLGHFDIEYEWMRMGATDKVAIPGKYTNEVKGGDCVEDINDAKYREEIIEIIK